MGMKQQQRGEGQRTPKVNRVIYVVAFITTGSYYLRSCDSNSSSECDKEELELEMENKDMDEEITHAFCSNMETFSSCVFAR